MAYCVHKYRRQYRLTEDEQKWVDEWKAWTPPVTPVIEKPLRESARQRKLDNEATGPADQQGELFHGQ